MLFIWKWTRCCKSCYYVNRHTLIVLFESRYGQVSFEGKVYKKRKEKITAIRKWKKSIELKVIGQDLLDTRSLLGFLRMDKRNIFVES